MWPMATLSKPLRAFMKAAFESLGSHQRLISTDEHRVTMLELFPV
jgi:hypothetical protein